MNYENFLICDTKQFLYFVIHFNADS